MRTKTLAALAAVGLTATVVATAGAASASTDAPRVERGERVLRTADQQVQALEVLSSVSPAGTLRLSGNDRYETAAEVSATTWLDGEPIVVALASGTSFPDALVWGASGLGYGSGPLLLTERDRLPDATRAELARLRPCFLVVLGGTPSVSDAVVADAEQYVDPTPCAAY